MFTKQRDEKKTHTSFIGLIEAKQISSIQGNVLNNISWAETFHVCVMSPTLLTVQFLSL